jgi:tetratricopeptide (TPR) repeat protein
LLPQPPAAPVTNAVIDAAWDRDYQRALLRSATERSLLFAHFSTTSVPLAKAMDQVLASEPVRRELQQGFVLAYLDSRHHAHLFERLLGTRGALGSAVVDRQGEPLARLIGFADARHVLAFVSEVQRRSPELERLQRQRSQAPASAELELELGDHFAVLGQQDRAREHYRTAEDIAQTSPSDHGIALARARQRLTLAALAAGDVSGARRELELARRSSHAWQLRSELAFAEAKLLGTERRVTDAIDLLEASLDLQEASPQAALLYAQLLHEQGQQSGAISALRDLLERSPPASVAADAQRELEHALRVAAGEPHAH